MGGTFPNPLPRLRGKARAGLDMFHPSAEGPPRHVGASAQSLGFFASGPAALTTVGVTLPEKDGIALDREGR